MSDAWASGAAYEPYVGRWSRLVATEFVDWLEVPVGRWVDLGCGTGALTQTVLDQCDPAEILAIDPSEDQLAWARFHVTDPRVSFRVGEVGDLAGHRADAVVSGLVLNFLPDPTAAAAVMRSVAPDGVIAAYVWDYAGRMELMRYFWDAAVDLDAAAASLDEGVRFAMCKRDRLEAVWREAGLIDVSSRAIDVPTRFGDFDDYWQPFLGGQGPAPGYAMSLDEERRTELRDNIRARLPIATDGSISLTARAWAVRGRG
jgi:trans-aconitate methyltransferase